MDDGSAFNKFSFSHPDIYIAFFSVPPKQNVIKRNILLAPNISLSYISNESGIENSSRNSHFSFSAIVFGCECNNGNFLFFIRAIRQLWKENTHYSGKHAHKWKMAFSNFIAFQLSVTSFICRCISFHPPPAAKNMLPQNAKKGKDAANKSNWNGWRARDWPGSAVFFG